MTPTLKRRIVPSILSADFADLSRQLKLVEQAGAGSVQIDVMDGHFVPNITVGPVVVKWMRKCTKLFLDVHLMIENPWIYVEEFVKAGAGLLTVHYEACPQPADVIAQIKKLGVKAGMAIKPKTPVEAFDPVLKDLDYALVMTVEPGFGGQEFMADMLPKVRHLREIIDREKLCCEVQVDGGINIKTAPVAAQAGATSLVAGSAVYGANDPARAFQELQKLVVDLPSISKVK
jgi:ribulose-phosphate 3-epimerase